jgi:O-antigen ligase
VKLDAGRAALYLAMAAATAALVSIAASQILLGAAIAAMLVSRRPWRLPPCWIPLAAFFLLTGLSVAFSGDPAAGWPQIKKFFLFAVLLLFVSLRPGVAEVRGMIGAWTAVSAVSAAIGLFQFAGKFREARRQGANFYEFYVGERTTGFMSHWMTFGGEQMIVLLLLGALLLFARRPRWFWPGWCAVALLGVSLLAGFTRSIWFGAGVGALYLAWNWRRAAVAALPLALGLVLWANPGEVRARFVSAFQPRNDRIDSNRFREVTRRAGYRMIAAHPWLGLGPGRVGPEFDRYVPADEPRPLPPGFYGHLHNIYVHYAAERGVPALLALLAFLGWVLADLARWLRRRAGDARFLWHGAVAMLLAILVSGFWEVNLGDSEVLTLVLAVLGSAYALAEREPEPAVGH